MLWLIFIQGLLAFGGSNACNIHLDTFHTGVWKVPEDTEQMLNISLSFNESSERRHDLETSGDLGALLIVTVVPDEDWKLNFVNSSIVFTAQEVNEGVVKNITFSGYYWGLTRLSFYLTRNDLDPRFKNRTLLRDDLQVVVDRRSRVVDIIFISVVSLFVLFNNINMGAQLDIKLIWGVLKKPVGPICGLLSQFLCMPTVTWIMGSLLFADTLQRLGLFTYGCCPGGTSSNFWTLMFNGDLNLSITMTAISFVAAMGMMPLWMFTLGSRLTEGDETIVIPFSNLAISLVALSFPVSIGILVRLKRPTWADKGKRILKPCSLFVLTFFLTVGIYNSYKVFLMMTWHMIVAGLLVVVTGYSFGALFAKVMCLERAQVIAVSIETAMQNTGVATILLKLSLESPFSDLATIPVFATFFVTGPPMIFFYFFCKIVKRLRNRKTGKSKENAQQAKPSTPESLPFLSGPECKTNDEESRNVCCTKDDGSVTICSVEYETLQGDCIKNDENGEDNCGGKCEDLVDNCGIKGDDMDNDYRIKSDDMRDNCRVVDDVEINGKTQYVDVEENSRSKGNDMENNCGMISNDIEDDCRMKGDDMEDNCKVQGIDMEDNCGMKTGVEDSSVIRGDNVENNSVMIGDNVEENCMIKDDDMDDNCRIKGNDKEVNCGMKDDMKDNCRIKGEDIEESGSKKNCDTEDNGNKIDVMDNHSRKDTDT